MTSRIANRRKVVTRIKMDNYLRSPNLTLREIAKVGINDMYDTMRLSQDLFDLAQGRPTLVPGLDPISMGKKFRAVKPTQVILVEGSFLFAFDCLTELLDLRVYFKADREVLVKRCSGRWPERERSQLEGLALSFFEENGACQLRRADVYVNADQAVVEVEANLDSHLTELCKIHNVYYH